MHNINFTDLETKGYLVIPNFLTPEKVSTLVEEYVKVKDSVATNKNYKIYNTTIASFLRSDLTKLADLVSHGTNIHVDYAHTNMIFFINSLINFGWHQDHESYYTIQNSYNHLKCWIPIIKPNPNKSGLDVIPHDKLLERVPEFFYDNIFGKGANEFKELSDGNTMIQQGDSDRVLTLDFKISELQYTPVLNPGDLLLMRGDLIHKSQSNEDFRVAVHVDILNTNGIISKEKFYTNSTIKKKYIKNNPENYKTIEKLFETNDEVSLKNIFN
jgi:ectoine hydroxylase-related dioxygenase (phytanoyl-CoA dioxygenase family)